MKKITWKNSKRVLAVMMAAAMGFCRMRRLRQQGIGQG